MNMLNWVKVSEKYVRTSPPSENCRRNSLKFAEVIFDGTLRSPSFLPWRSDASSPPHRTAWECCQVSFWRDMKLPELEGVSTSRIQLGKPMGRTSEQTPFFKLFRSCTVLCGGVEGAVAALPLPEGCRASGLMNF